MQYAGVIFIWLSSAVGKAGRMVRVKQMNETGS
jgi:hypothetical protein